MLALRLIMIIIDIWMWCKPKRTDLLLNYNANCPKKFAYSYRVKLMCFNGFIFFNEVIVLRNMFVFNVMVLNLFLLWHIFAAQKFCDQLTFYESKNKTKLRSSKIFQNRLFVKIKPYLFNRALVRYLLLNIIDQYINFSEGLKRAHNTYHLLHQVNFEPLFSFAPK